MLLRYEPPLLMLQIYVRDKWKNLVKACKKVLIFSSIYLSSCYFASAALTILPCICLTLQENGRMFLPLDQALLERIMEIDRREPYPKQSNSAQDCLALPLTSPNLHPALRWSVVKSRTK